MAAISMNESLRELIERALLITTVFTDEADIQTLKDDIVADHVTVETLQILKRALVEMKEERTLHSYIAGSKMTFPAFKPKVVEVSRQPLSSCRNLCHCVVPRFFLGRGLFCYVGASFTVLVSSSNFTYSARNHHQASLIILIILFYLPHR